MNTILAILSLALLQSPASSAAPAPQATDAPKATFGTAASQVENQLAAALNELSVLRERVATEKVPLTRRIGELENQLIEARQKLQQVQRVADSRALDLTNLSNEIKGRQEEVSYLSNLMLEYLRNAESGMHIAELQRWRGPLEQARLAADNSSLGKRDVFEKQLAALTATIDRLEDSFGGARFDGTAVDPAGQVVQGKFLVLGPAAFFGGQGVTGIAEQKLGSLEPNVTPYKDPLTAKAATDWFAGTSGSIPFDPTMGTADKIAQSEETVVEHFLKGGPVMWPILGVAVIVAIVALIKWLTMVLIRTPSRRRFQAVLKAIAEHDDAKAQDLAAKLPGPTGRMVAAGASCLSLSREVMEEQMFEVMQKTKARVNSMLPLLAISAAAAPLLGLLGTVTGIMDTFKAIEIYGTGDVKTLSGGISEALITTEYGLIVAIPALLLHAILSAQARGITSRMEASGLAFINEFLKRGATQGN